MRLQSAPSADVSQSGDSGSLSELSQPSASQVQVAVLGPLSLTVGGRPLAPRASRQRRLLTILAVQAGRPTSGGIEDMVTAVYGADAAPRARHSLATELWRLRQVLGPDAVRTGEHGYEFDHDLVDVDVVRFARLLAAGRAALRQQAPAEAVASMSRALAMWRGEPLVDLGDHPVGQAERVRLEELRLGGIEDYAEALAATGDHERALDLLDELTGDHPTREHAWALLVEYAVGVGQPRRARQAFDSARRMLSEYGVDLGAELREAQALLRDGRALTARAQERPSGAASGAEPALVGREAEIERARRPLLTALSAKSPAVVVVTGEPGIGKTALAEHVAAGCAVARAGTLVGRVTGDRRLQLPYAPLRALLGQLAGQVPTVPPLIAALLGTPGAAGGSGDPGAPASATTGRLAMREAVADLVEAAAAAAGGLVIVVDDAQWATTETLEALLHLLARRAAVPLGVLVTMRQPAPADEVTADLLAELRRRAAEVIALVGLDVQATGLLVGAGPDVTAAHRAHQLTGGNPLYVRQWASTGGHAGTRRPDTLDDAIGEHLAALPSEVVDLLRFAAVGGTRVDRRVLTAAAARPPLELPKHAVADALDAAERAGLVRVDPADPLGLAFVHVLVRDHLYAAIPAAERVTAHAAFVEALERQSAGSAAAVDLLAHHALNAWPACPTATVVERLQEAGRHAAAQLGFDRALGYYGNALDLLGLDEQGADPAAVADLLEATAQSAAAAANGYDEAPSAASIAQARSAYAALESLAKRHELLDVRLRATVGEVRSYSLERIDAGAVDRLESALETAAGDAGLSQLPADLLGDALAELRTYRPERSQSLQDRILERVPDRSGAIGVAVWDRQGVVDRLVTAERLVGDPTADPVGAWVRLWASEVAAGRRALHDPPVLQAALEEGSEQSRWELSAWQVTAAIAGGRFDRAERLLQAAGAQVSRAGSSARIATRAAGMMGQRIRLSVLRADRPLTAADVEQPHATWVTALPVMRAWTAYFAASTGQRELAWQLCTELQNDFADGLVGEAGLVPWAIAASIAAVAVDHRRCADTCRQVLAPHGGHHGIYSVTAYWGAVDHHRGRLAALAGDLDDAVADLATAVVQYRRIGARAYEGRALRDLASARWHRGRGDDRQVAAADQRAAATLARDIGLGGVASAPWPPPTPVG